MKFSGLSQKDQGNQAPGPVDHKGNGEAPCPKMWLAHPNKEKKSNCRSEFISHVPEILNLAKYEVQSNLASKLQHLDKNRNKKHSEACATQGKI